MTLAVLTPFHRGGKAVDLGNRTWVKKLLPVGDVDYKGRTLHFTPAYLGALVRSFESGAYDQVPFQLADSANTHTNDPDRTRGWVTGMELRDDGLYVQAEVTPEGEAVLTANPKLGISARIVEDYSRSDGQHFPAAVQHVLGTLDPRIPGLGGWTAIEAANDADEVIDLSSAQFTGLPPKKKHGKAKQTDLAGDGADLEGNGVPDLSKLNEAQQAKLAALLALPDETLEALADGGTVLTADEMAALADPDDGDEDGDGGGDSLAGEIDGMSDDELAALEAEFEAQAAGEPAAAALSAEAQFSINLANARADETARELAVVTARLREEDYQTEKRRLADLGVPPYITELARPLLEGAGHAVELANGKTVDAGAVMRSVLSEYARQAQLLDLGAELGSPMDEPDGAGADEAAAHRNDVVSRMKTVTGLR